MFRRLFLFGFSVGVSCDLKLHTGHCPEIKPVPKRCQQLALDLKYVHELGAEIDSQQVCRAAEATRGGSSSEEHGNCLAAAVQQLCCFVLDKNQIDRRVASALFQTLYFYELHLFRASPLFHREPKVPVGKRLPNIEYFHQHERDLREQLELYMNGEISPKAAIEGVKSYHWLLQRDYVDQ